MEYVRHKRTNTVWVHLNILRTVKFIETVSRKVVARGEGEGEMGSYCSMGTVSVWNDEKILEMDDGNGCKTMWMHLIPIPLECILKND